MAERVVCRLLNVQAIRWHKETDEHWEIRRPKETRKTQSDIGTVRNRGRQKETRQSK